MGDLVNHPRRTQRIREVKFKLTDAISRLGVQQAFKEMPEDKKEKLWREAYVYEVEMPNAGVEVLREFFSDQPYKNQLFGVYNT